MSFSYSPPGSPSNDESFPFSLSLSRSHTGTPVEKLNATDLDTGENAEIVYRIQQGSFNDFHIDNRSGLLTVAKPLDYDVRPNYTLEIVAYDKGVPSLSGKTTLAIQLINTNDKSPFFTPATQRADVSEDAEIGTFVHQLAANDPDITSLEFLEFALDDTLTTAVSEDGTEVVDSKLFADFIAIDKQGRVTVNRKLRRDLFVVSFSFSFYVLSISHKIQFNLFCSAGDSIERYCHGHDSAGPPTRQRPSDNYCN